MIRWDVIPSPGKDSLPFARQHVVLSGELIKNTYFLPIFFHYFINPSLNDRSNNTISYAAIQSCAQGVPSFTVYTAML